MREGLSRPEGVPQMRALFVCLATVAAAALVSGSAAPPKHAGGL